ncbi:hypothetical protein BDB01DRAFT_769420 [Pilobolus umbonatus]|nr:hypothetical protein BDB01DRAFT_769420 [Pilobolus umbonatus]
MYTIYALILLCIQQSVASDIKMFCKCFCGSNSTIFELPLIDPKPCSLCNKKFCLENVESGMCDGIADETCPSNDFRTTCFARDSYKDEIIVRCFLILTFTLVVCAIIKPYIEQWRKNRITRSQYTAVAIDDN